MDDHDQYSYAPLKHPWDLRLVELLPGTGDEPICCYIWTTPGGDAKNIDPQFDPAEHGNTIPYRALSYTWGDARVPKKTIWLDWRPFRVTANLFAFLKQWRPEEGHPSHFLWIDAISINQQDTLERNTQVHRMTSIYECAQFIPIWLGPAADNSDVAMKVLRQVGEYIYTANQEGRKYDFALGMECLLSQGHVRISGDNVSLDEALAQALVKLLERPWWTRVWIAQEATVKDELRTFVLCGDREYNWSRLLIAFNAIGIAAGAAGPLSQLVDNLPAILTLGGFQINRIIGGENLHLFNLLIRFREYKATDDRDKVYALLGMAKQATGERLPEADYRKTTQDVYREVAQYIIRTNPYGQNLDLLGYADDYHDQFSEVWLNAIAGPRAKLFLELFADVQDLFRRTNLRFESEEDFHKALEPLMTASRPFGRAFQSALNSSKNHAWTLEPGACRDINLCLNLIENGPRTDEKYTLAEWKQLLRVERWFRSLEPDLMDLVWRRQDWLQSMGLDPVMVLDFMTTVSDIFDLITNHPYWGNGALIELTDTDSDFLPPTPPTWPSWVPDWRLSSLQSEPLSRRSENLPKLGDVDMTSYRSLYSASGSDKATISKYLGSSDMITFENNDMLVQGFRIDTIRETKSLFLLYITSDLVIKERLSSWISSTIGLNYRDESVENALNRTLTADITIRSPNSRVQRLPQGSNGLEIADPYSSCSGRLLAITAENLMGLVPTSAEEGNEIYLLAGGQVFYVLRPQEDGFRLIGESYVHGLMDGEALDRLESGEQRLSKIRLR